MMTNWLTATSTIDPSRSGPARNSRASTQPTQKTPEKMNQPAVDPIQDDRRKGVRRTVTICVLVVLVFFLISFVQIVLMK
jgi:hypothetical protein